ncbi:MAG: hypothetical protein AAGJ32_06920 [Pseudomonadota bacterium]
MTALAVRLGVFGSALACLAQAASAQLSIENPSPTSTALPPQTGCFEIFLSPRQVRETYLLNACTGDVWMRVSGDDRAAWQSLPRESNAQDTETLSLVKHYKIISSGLTAQDTFLLNTLNGATWQLFEAANGSLFWGAMEREAP